MNSVEQVRNAVMSLSASERASLAHELILSLDDPTEFHLGVQYEAEIQARMNMVREGSAKGRPASEVFAELRKKHSS